ITAVPGFAANGYYITPASPAYNQATPSDVTFDVNGGSRPSCGILPDLGAHERQCLLLPFIRKP
ncbi:MAG: hypothetical protein KC421_23800, partial [Anaerolineales bacterium]|nr:hypothetical protein [Anaerolineales bacterium]